VSLIKEDYLYPDLNTCAKYTMAVAVMMTGVAAHRIRKFEEAGLFKPKRTGNKQRLYSDEDIKIIRRIIYLEKDGVNLQGIKIILEIQDKQENKGEKI
jgi:MerR family transcriptional regulator, heat shock protein HspR